MTNNKQQTAVEWYHQQIVDRQNGNGDSRSLDEIFQQAKEMEKEQIVKAVNKGWKYNEDGFVSWMGEQYYNETYEGSEQ
jgi:hypothetical protein